MDNILKGRTLLVGREPGKNNLCIATMFEGGYKGVPIGNPDSVPKTVSRCQKGTAHCSIEIDNNGNMFIKPLKTNPLNPVFVNGVSIERKKIYEDSSVQLGSQYYDLNVKQIVDAAANLLKKLLGIPLTPQPGGVGGKKIGGAQPPQPPKQEKVYSISHLSYIWQSYDDGQTEIQQRQQKLNNKRMITPIFSLTGSALSTLFLLIDSPFGKVIGLICITIGLIITVVTFVKSKNNDFITERKQLTEWFQDNYICPNPECHHFMGNQPYKILKQHKKCPYCGVKLVE